MKRHTKDRAGETYGHLTLLSIFEEGGGRPRKWMFRCVCGTEKFIAPGNVFSGSITSCGCRRCEKRTTHGASGDPERRRLWNVWKNMRKRCNNKNAQAYKHYGGRGIKISSEWNDFSVFEADMAASYVPGLEIDRIDNDKGYSKDNCRWATREQQTNNTRRTRLFTLKGEVRSVSQWARKLKLNRRSLHSRLFREGWPIEKALTHNIHKIPEPHAKQTTLAA